MWHYIPKDTFLERLPHGADLLVAIRDLFEGQGSRMGFFAAIGAVEKATVGFYNQQTRSYETLSIDEPAEILSCVGNVSELKGSVMIHGHITLGLKDGSTKGGHLMQGTLIFACELFGCILEGPQLVRTFDDETGLNLWRR
jgi:uncharacterized protein